MQLMLRPPSVRPHPLMRRRGMRGLGDGEINPTTIWTPSTGFIDPSYGGTAPATYVAPNYVPVPACASGPTMFTAECIAQVLAAQQANMAADLAANRAVFVANCNNDWAANAAQYQALGMAVPPNDCEYRSYGQTLPGTTGSTTAYLPGTPQEIIDWRNANPGGGSPGPVGATSGVVGNATFSFTNLTTGDNANFNVGDRWQILITGAPPGSAISVNGGLNGQNVVTNQGTADGSGRFALNGQMTADQVGNWTEAWRVNNGIVASFAFTVRPSGSAVAGGTTTGGSSTTTAPPNTIGSGFDFSSIQTSLTKPISIGGSSFPMWMLAAAGVVLFMVIKK